MHRIGQSAFYAVCSWDAVEECVNRSKTFRPTSPQPWCIRTTAPSRRSPWVRWTILHTYLRWPTIRTHAMHRKVLVPHLSAKRVRDIESFAAATADRLWRENVHGGQIEWMSAMANRLPMMVVARLIGVPDDDVDQLIRWAYATTTLLDGIVAADQLQAAGVAAMELGGYVLERFEKAAANPADNLARRPRKPLRQWRTGPDHRAGHDADPVRCRGRVHCLPTGQRRMDIGHPPRYSARSPRQPRAAGTVHRRGAAIRTAVSRPLSACTQRHRPRRCRPTRRFPSLADVGGRQPRPRPLRKPSTSSGSIGEQERATSPLARVRTSASGPHSPGWRPRLCSVSSLSALRRSKPPKPGAGCRASCVRRLEHLKLAVK